METKSRGKTWEESGGNSEKATKVGKDEQKMRVSTTHF